MPTCTGGWGRDNKGVPYLRLCHRHGVGRLGVVTAKFKKVNGGHFLGGVKVHRGREVCCHSNNKRILSVVKVKLEV